MGEESKDSIEKGRDSNEGGEVSTGGQNAKGTMGRGGKYVPRSSSGLGVWSWVAGLFGMKVIVVDGVEGGIFGLERGFERLG